jgi:ligand-binding SRPBCC domain-containing protein
VASFRLETTIDASVAVVFDLARDIDVHTRSLVNSNERAVAGVTTGLIELGESVTWQAKHFGIPFEMTSIISEMERPERFVDEQTKGPFKWFRHQHTFVASDGGTVMIDEITFESPVGPVGSLVDRVFLEGYMERLIADRNAVLKIEAEAQKPGSPR